MKNNEKNEHQCMVCKVFVKCMINHLPCSWVLESYWPSLSAPKRVNANEPYQTIASIARKPQWQCTWLDTARERNNELIFHLTVLMSESRWIAWVDVVSANITDDLFLEFRADANCRWWFKNTSDWFNSSFSCYGWFNIEISLKFLWDHKNYKNEAWFGKMLHIGSVRTSSACPFAKSYLWVTSM